MAIFPIHLQIVHFPAFLKKNILKVLSCNNCGVKLFIAFDLHSLLRNNYAKISLALI